MSGEVLVVDDSSFQRSLVSETVSEWLNVVDTAKNGREAVELFNETQPDVITMDIMMPEMNGIEALTEIKQQSPETTIVMVTSVSQKEKMREAAKAGADGYVTKPFEAEELGSELDDALDSPVTT
jgi:two-component system chemotaxis response regulator CheY